MREKISTKVLVSVGVFIGISVVLRAISIMVPIAGTGAMRVSFDGIFYKMPGILFGPTIGGIAGGLVDILSYIVRPMGVYIPLLTLTNILGGLLTAVIWRKVKNTSVKKIKIYYIGCFLCISILGILNHMVILLLPNSFIGKFLSSLGKKAEFVGVGFEIIAILAFVTLIVNEIIKEKVKNDVLYETYMKMIVSVGITGIIITTLNTFILMLFIPALAGKGFMILWIPRIAEQFFMIIIESYIMSALLIVYNNVIGVVENKKD